MRHYSYLDKIINTLDGFRNQKSRAYPAESLIEPDLSLEERRQAASLMRVNYSGEVAAQALYQAQGLMARSDAVKAEMKAAALEEQAHLEWCGRRLRELDARPSVLNPLWYVGSFAIGLLAALPGDESSLSFLAETEVQVANHLREHLGALPFNDIKTRAILNQMLAEEEVHAETAMNQGGRALPGFIIQLMRNSSKVMTLTSRYI